MRIFKFWLGIVILGILQVTVLDYAKIFNVKPDLLLISISLASLVFGLGEALVLSVFAGLFKDVIGIGTFGINTFLFTLWSLLIGKLAKEISIENNFRRTTLIFIITILHNIIMGLTFVYCGKSIPLGLFLRIVSIESIYTAGISPLVFWVIIKCV